MSPLAVEDLAAVTVGAVEVAGVPRAPAVFSVSLQVVNGSTRWLSSPQGPYAFNLALRWIDDDAELPPDLPRVPLPRPLAPGATATIHLLVPAPAESGIHTLRITAVAEGIAWREHLGGPGAYGDAVAPIAPGR